MSQLILTGIGIAIGVALWPLLLPGLIIAWLIVLFRSCSGSHHDTVKPPTSSQPRSSTDTPDA
jgi:hypothetical protein